MKKKLEPANQPKPKPHERVRSAMALKGYNSYEEMAKAIGMSLSAFTQKINGKRQFGLDECNLIASKLETTLDVIFFAPIVPKREHKKKTG